MNTGSSHAMVGVRHAIESYGSRASYRFLQGIRALLPSVPPNRDAILAATMSNAQQSAFRALSTVDQAHLLRTYSEVMALEPNAQMELRVAALMHDIGKASPTGRVRLVHRVMRVTVGKYLPGVWARLAQLPPGSWRTGFVLAEHHPALGAEIAASLGCAERTVWLIAEHGRKRVPTDIPDLRTLMIADYRAR